MKKILQTLIALIPLITNAQQPNPLLTEDAQAQKHWVDSIYNTLSLDEKVGQLFMISVFSKNENLEYVNEVIDKYKIGGIIFSKGGPQRQAILTNQYQKKSRVPLMIGMDAEWGLAMRLDSTYAYPWNMTLGAIKNNDLIRRTGQRIAAHCKALGVHIDFAPDVDINTNPDNPIIGNRSFGEDVENVSQKGVAFLEGMQQEGVLANAKHFPGHGDTAQDSHKTLPQLNHSVERFWQTELPPFQSAIAHNVASVMVGHLNIPALEPKEGLPSSLSYEIITKLLKEKLGFNGLVFTDALGMNGVANYLPAGKSDLEAFMAGNDMLLMPKDVAKAVKELKNAYYAKRITEERLAYSVKKILMAKYKLGLNKYQPIDRELLKKQLHTLADDVLMEELAENALTLIKNTEEVLPIQNIEKGKVAYVKLGKESGQDFYQMMRMYADVPRFVGTSSKDLVEKTKDYETIVVGVHKPDNTPWDSYQLTAQEKEMIQQLSKNKKVILVVFARPYALKNVDLSSVNSVVVAYQNNKVFQQKAAQLVFGAIEAKGVLPVSISKEFPVNTSLSSRKLQRLSYGLPASVKMNAEKLAIIDTLAAYAIKKKMTPGMQVLVAKQGKVVYQKAFGDYDYTLKQKVTDTTIYDLASLTKILSTLPEMMKLYGQGAYSINDSLSTLLPYYKGSNKANLKVVNILSHYAQLRSWIPFYLSTLGADKRPNYNLYHKEKSEDYSLQVSDNLYIRNDYEDEMYKEIKDSPLITKKRYWYSDLPFYMFKKYIEKSYHQPLNELVQKDFYQSMGAYRLTYKPLEKFSKNQIPPTEEDTYFRYTKVQGYVHDMGAAMQGGVGGHAGLFGNANDVAKMMQMYLQKGYYGGKWYLMPKTVDLFNTCMFCNENNRRGLGFDKPQLEEEGPTCGCVPMSSFGHTGFTGTYAWADPDNEIVYVFLSNRTYPTSENKKLIKENIRTLIQEVIYQANE